MDRGLNCQQPLIKATIAFVKPFLSKGTWQQARDALTVFDSMWKKGKVSNPPFLLKALAEKSRKDELALPQKKSIQSKRDPQGTQQFG